MSDIVDRLRCRYACGPMIDGKPEFGWRDMSGPITTTLPTGLMIEAAIEIERLRDALEEHSGAPARERLTKSPPLFGLPSVPMQVRLYRLGWRSKHSAGHVMEGTDRDRLISVLDLWRERIPVEMCWVEVSHDGGKTWRRDG